MPRCLLGPLAVVALLAAAPGAHAVTTIGPSPLQGSGLTNVPSCGGSQPCTYLQTRGGTVVGTAPFDAVVVRWRLGAGSAGGQVKLRVIRPGAAGAFSGAGTGQTRTASTGINVFEGERVPMRAGDAIGLDNASDGLYFLSSGDAANLLDHWTPFLADGSSRAPTGTTQGLVLQLNADVEADADGDGFGDETQDACPSDGARQAPPCAVGPVAGFPPAITGLRAIPNRVRRGRRTTIGFRLSEQAAWRMRFERAVPGRRRSGRCVPQTSRVRTGRRCTLYRSRGTVTGTGGPGRVSVVFRGALSTARSLPPGRYRITVIATDVDGASRPARTFLTLLPPVASR